MREFLMKNNLFFVISEKQMRGLINFAKKLKEWDFRSASKLAKILGEVIDLRKKQLRGEF